MTGEFKAVVLDVDDTLVPSDPKALPSEADAAAIREARSHNVLVHAATGRPFRVARHVLRAAGIEDRCVMNGGSEIVDPLTGHPIYATPMTDEAQHAVRELLHARQIPVFDSQGQYGGGRALLQRDPVDPNNTKLFVLALETELATELVREITQLGDIAAYQSTSWMPGDVVDLHITDSTATKQGAVDTLIDMDHLVPADVIAVGDSPIDIPMFRSVGFSVAMGNAPAEVKAAADVVAPPLEEDGVAWVLRKYVLPKANVRVFPVTR